MSRIQHYLQVRSLSHIARSNDTNLDAAALEKVRWISHATEGFYANKTLCRASWGRCVCPLQPARELRGVQLQPPSTVAMHPSVQADCIRSVSCGHLCSVRAQDIRVTSIENSHRRAPEELTAGGTELDLYHYVVSADVIPSTACIALSLLLRAPERLLPSRAVIAPSLGLCVFILLLADGGEGLRCCRRSGGPRTWRACCSLCLPSADANRSSGVGLNVHSSSDFRRGGVLPAMMMSFALPERRVLRVDL